MAKAATNTATKAALDLIDIHPRVRAENSNRAD